MVQSCYGGWNIWYIPNLHGNHTLRYFRNDCGILKQKNLSEESDLSSSKKREQQIRQQPLLPSDRCLFCVKRLESQGNNMLKTLVKCMTKTSEDSVKKQSQENKISTSFCRCKILTWLLEKHITMPPVGEITLDRMIDTRKPSLKPFKSKLPTRQFQLFSTSFSMLWAESFRDKEITTLRKHDETGTFHASSL